MQQSKPSYLQTLPLCMISGVSRSPVLFPKIADKVRAAVYKITVTRQHTVVSIPKQ